MVLCLEGGPNTLKTMSEAINNNTPVVVIGGSGRAADVVCYAYQHLDRFLLQFFLQSFFVDFLLLLMNNLAYFYPP